MGKLKFFYCLIKKLYCEFASYTKTDYVDNITNICQLSALEEDARAPTKMSRGDSNPEAKVYIGDLDPRADKREVEEPFAKIGPLSHQLHPHFPVPQSPSSLP